MSDRFDQMVSQLEPLSRALLASQLRPVARSKDLIYPGIYVFYEGDQAVYVGITKCIGNRLRDHISASGSRSAFAFRRAKEALGLGNATYRKEGSRRELVKDDAFREALKKHKADILQMQFRELRVDDPLVLFHLELYVALKLNLPVTEFQTH